MKIHNVEQGSSEWHDLRLGKITASRVKDMMTKSRKDEIFGDTAKTYMNELIAETLTGESTMIDNISTRWGHEYEPEARLFYAHKSGFRIEVVGFITRDDFPLVGMSPDGLIGNDGLVEIKCPYTSKTHIEYFLSDTVPKAYIDQVQFQLWVSGRAWCDFVSYDPRMPIKNKLSIVRVLPDKVRHTEFAGRCKLFSEEMAKKLEKMGML